MNLETLKLHDATLTAIKFDWGAAVCVVSTRPMGRSSAQLIFDGVSCLHVPHLQPWGPSRSINSITELEFGKYEIEMQSGDTIEITAEHIVFNVTEF